MACRALRHRLQRCLPKENLPAVPCIAVKNDMLINDPDFPVIRRRENLHNQKVFFLQEASDHFCTPLTIEESNHRLKVGGERDERRRARRAAATRQSQLQITFERGNKRTKMKEAAEASMRSAAAVVAATTPPPPSSMSLNGAAKSPASGNGKEAATATVQMTAGRPLNLDQWTAFARNLSGAVKDEALDDTHFSSSGSSGETKDTSGGQLEASSSSPSSSTAAAHSATPPPGADESSGGLELMDVDGPPARRSRLDVLLRLEEQRATQAERDKSTSPDENLNIANFAQKLLEQPTGSSDIAALFNNLTSALVANAAAAGSPTTSSSARTATASPAVSTLTASSAAAASTTATVTAAAVGSELAKALTKCNGKPVTSTQQAAFPTFDNVKMSDFVEKYMKNNWQLPEDCKFSGVATRRCWRELAIRFARPFWLQSRSSCAA